MEDKFFHAPATQACNTTRLVHPSNFLQQIYMVDKVGGYPDLVVGEYVIRRSRRRRWWHICCKFVLQVLLWRVPPRQRANTLAAARRAGSTQTVVARLCFLWTPPYPLSFNFYLVFTHSSLRQNSAAALLRVLPISMDKDVATKGTRGHMTRALWGEKRGEKHRHWGA